MKTALVTTFAAASIVLATAAARAAVPPLAPDAAVKLKAWLDTQAIPPASTLGFVETMDGAIVPKYVELHEIPTAAGVPSATEFRYAKLGDRVVLVDPADRTIVYQLM